jgi:hypothetical protein
MVNEFQNQWTEEHKNEYLENSYLLKEIDIRKNILVKDYHKLCEILNDFSSICSLQKFLQIRTLVGSRNFGLWIDGKKQATMVPLGDMLNHSATPDVKWFFEKETNAFVMNSIHSIISQGEISDSYGTKCNRSYIIFYGFVLSDNNKCRNTIFLQLNQPISTLKIQSLRDQKFDDRRHPVKLLIEILQMPQRVSLIFCSYYTPRFIIFILRRYSL